jgi:hypothetical protein
MWLRNWEHNSTSGLPISGAAVEVRLASLVSPNTGAIIASTTTDANGMWEFLTLPDQAVDVKVVFGGNTWWHKGMTKHSVDAIFYVTPTPRTDQFLKNAGFEKGPAGPWTVTNVETAVFGSWLAQNGTGSSASLSRELTIHALDSDVAAKIVQTRVSGALELYERMPIPSVYRGKTATVSFQIRQGIANSTRAFIRDSAGTTYSATSATTGGFVTLTVTRTIDAGATSVLFGISVDVSDTVYVDNAIANLGAVAATYQPEYWFAGAITTEMLADEALTPAIGGVPHGAIFMFRTSAEIPVGYTAVPELVGRLPAGAGGSLVENTTAGSFVPNVSNGSLGVSDGIFINNGTLGISDTLGVGHNLSVNADSSGGAVSCGAGCTASPNGHSHGLSGTVFRTGSVALVGSVAKGGTVALVGSIAATTSIPSVFVGVFARRN